MPGSDQYGEIFQWLGTPRFILGWFFFSFLIVSMSPRDIRKQGLTRKKRMIGLQRVGLL